MPSEKSYCDPNYKTAQKITIGKNEADTYRYLSEGRVMRVHIKCKPSNAKTDALGQLCSGNMSKGKHVKHVVETSLLRTTRLKYQWEYLAHKQPSGD